MLAKDWVRASANFPFLLVGKIRISTFIKWSYERESEAELWTEFHTIFHTNNNELRTENKEDRCFNDNENISRLESDVKVDADAVSIYSDSESFS